MRVALLLASLLLAATPAVAVPPNDLCESPTEVPEEQSNRFFDTVDLPTASFSPGELDALCGPEGDLARTVWYRWTAPDHGQLVVLTGCTSTYPIVTTVFEGDCSEYAFTGCDATPCLAATVVNVSSDTTYLVQVGAETMSPVSGPLFVQLCFLGPDQDDQDDDGTPDCLDTCTDSDFDGYGDGPLAERPFDQCPEDNCPDVTNSDQADKDGDGVGDACDDDEEKDEKTMQEAAEDGEVELSDKDCYAGDCVRITIRNRGTRGIVVNVRTGDVLLNRDESEQDLGVMRDQRIFVPPDGTVTLGGIFTVCLEHDRRGPAAERIFDVADNVDVAPGAPNLVAIGAVLALPGQRSFPRSEDIQSATWAITNGSGTNSVGAEMLRAVGLDPDALPEGGFPDLVNPNAGSTDPVSRYLPGLLGAGGGGPCIGDVPLARAACALDRVDAAIAALSSEVKAKMRRKLAKRTRAVRGKVTAAQAAGDDAKKVARRTAAAQRKAAALLRTITNGAQRGKLGDAGALLAAASEVAAALAQ